MHIFLLFLLGLCFGSFVTMASHRLPRDLAMGRQRSRCPKCSHVLGVRDLFPVLSWLAAAGKCRYCAARVSWRYPLTELLLGGLFALLYASYGPSIPLAVLLLFTTALLTMLVADLETGLIPDEIHFFLLPLGIGYHWLVGSDPLTVGLCAGVGLLLGLSLHYCYHWLRGKHGLGLGDVKFLLVAGLWLGDLHALVVFIFFSGLLGVLLGLSWKIVTKQERFPFGPALAASLWLLTCYPASGNIFWTMLQRMIGG